MLAEADIAIIGGGIVGLAIARELLDRSPGLSVVLAEKEPAVAMHQSGRNSGVIHSGIYYVPGSLKARLARTGCASMKEFCRAHGVPFETTGKLIAAFDEREVRSLGELEKRGRDNGVACQLLDPIEAREIEPAVNCERALLVPSAGIVDYRRVAERLAEKVEELGGRILLGSEILEIERIGGKIELTTPRGAIRAERIVSAGGLQSDRIAKLDGVRLRVRILPFRGEYYDVVGDSARLVRTMIYPVPDPRYPFLGVHLTRSIDGTVHAGPNAVLALAREGYRRSDLVLRDLVGIFGYSGFWKFLLRHAGTAMAELRRSLSRSRFTESVQRLVPALEPRDLVPSVSGVRAQALRINGDLVDDFLLEERDGALHVLNAPSPAATASLEIARIVVDRLER